MTGRVKVQTSYLILRAYQGEFFNFRSHHRTFQKILFLILRFEAPHGTYLDFGNKECSIAGEREHSHKLVKNLRCGLSLALSQLLPGLR